MFLHRDIVFYSNEKKRQPRRIYSLRLLKTSFAFLETQLGRHTLLYKLTRKVMICLLGSTNPKLISSCACFTCRIRILIKHNKPSLQEISTKINWWYQGAGGNNSPLSTSPLWTSAVTWLRHHGHETMNCILSTWYTEKQLFFTDNYQHLNVLLYKSLFLQQLH